MCVSDNEAEKVLYTNEVVLRGYGETRIKAPVIKVVLAFSAVMERIALARLRITSYSPLSYSLRLYALAGSPRV